MNIEEYIASGILELYVYGQLTAQENLEVKKMMDAHPEIRKEVEAIEMAVFRLSSGTAPYLSARNYEKTKVRLNLDDKVRTLQPNRWAQYTGWAAAVIFAVGTYTFFNQYKNSKDELEVVSTENETLKKDIQVVNAQNDEYSTVLSFIRGKDTEQVELGGQAASPNSFAQVYWDKQSQKVIVDASGLPEPPEGFEYQVWALKLNPLTPTSIGLLSNFTANSNKLFEVANVAEAEAFGITLEPAGGSETPTLEQLYTLGQV